MFAKIVSGQIEFAPINNGNVLNYGNCAEMCLADGYKEFVDVPQPEINPATQTASFEYVENETCITKEWTISDIEIVVPSALEAFDPSQAIAREAQVFTAEELDRFTGVSYMVNELIRQKNFWGGTLPGGITYVGLKQMAAQFILSGKIQQSDYDKLNGILKEQNIDLDNPPA